MGVYKQGNRWCVKFLEKTVEWCGSEAEAFALEEKVYAEHGRKPLRRSRVLPKYVYRDNRPDHANCPYRLIGPKGVSLGRWGSVEKAEEVLDIYLRTGVKPKDKRWPNRRRGLVVQGIERDPDDGWLP